MLWYAMLFGGILCRVDIRMARQLPVIEDGQIIKHVTIGMYFCNFWLLAWLCLWTLRRFGHTCCSINTVNDGDLLIQYGGTQSIQPPLLIKSRVWSLLS